MILCDIGNTTFHFLIQEESHKVSLADDLDIFRERLNLLEVDTLKLYYISVNEEATKKLLKIFPYALDLEPYIELQTNYESTLGIDRKLACLTVHDGIVVDFGSAITIDCMENGIHQGGSIVIGFDTLAKSYPLISKRLHFEFNDTLPRGTLPANTQDAISFGIISMVVGAIEYTKKYKKELPLIITGETSSYFLPYLTQFEFKKELIFDGMKHIIKELQW